MNLKHHFKFHISDAKQLGIALTSSITMWAATGFSRQPSAFIYPIVGFVTGGLASHNSTSNPGVLPDSHIETPYANNINDNSSNAPEPLKETNIYKPENVDIKKIIKINSGIIK